LRGTSPINYYEYSPFGKITKKTGTLQDDFEYRFSSEIFDIETELVYYNFRYYSPELGRWLSRDPIEEDGGYNLYGMVGNNPVDYWDELGEQGKSYNNKRITGHTPGAEGALSKKEKLNARKAEAYKKNNSRGSRQIKGGKNGGRVRSGSSVLLLISLIRAIPGSVAEGFYIKDKMLNEDKSLLEALGDLLDDYGDDDFDIMNPETWDKDKRKKPCPPTGSIWA
jgi:RHS repeat-associated protein